MLLDTCPWLIITIICGSMENYILARGGDDDDDGSGGSLFSLAIQKRNDILSLRAYFGIFFRCWIQYSSVHSVYVSHRALFTLHI